MQKRVAAIHDLSCFGKCSLTVALPVISSMGVECAVLPTAMLSGHFAALPQVDVLDLTDHMETISAQWKAGNVKFDGIFSGYLSSAAQVQRVTEFVKTFRKAETLYIADPAMADRGKLYRGFDESHVRAMRKLCQMSDVTLPNVTEACMMLGEHFSPIQTETQAEKLVRGMLELGAKQVVITGVSLAEDRVGIACSDGGKTVILDKPKTPGHYNGTGDLFGSVFTAALMQGKPLLQAAEQAMNFTSHVIAETAKNPHHRPYGVDFEQHLHLLMNT